MVLRVPMKKVMQDIAETKYKLVADEGGKINAQKFWKMKKKQNPNIKKWTMGNA